MSMKWNESYFRGLGKSGPVLAKLLEHGHSVQARARGSAPVDTGEYRDGIVVRVKSATNRNVVIVDATDPKSLIIEADYGVLGRALRAEKTSG